MSEQNENAARKEPAKDGRGRRVPDWMRKTIVQTFLALVREGKTGRETSAIAVRARIHDDHPDVVEELPSMQTINSILKTVRDGLADDALNKNWSLSLWMEEPHDIAREDLPLILAVQKKLATDIPTRSARGFKVNRLTVREAKWIGPVYAVLTNSENVRNDKNPGRIRIELQTMAKLIGFTRSLALREQAARLVDDPPDSYDIDLNLSWEETPTASSEPPRPGIRYLQADKQLRLFQEMSLIPTLRVWENIFLSRRKKIGGKSRKNFKK